MSLRIFKRNLKNWGVSALTVLGYAIAFAVIFSIFELISSPPSMYMEIIASSRTLLVWFACLLLISLQTGSGMIWGITLSFGCRKKELFGGLQLMNVLVIAGISILYIIISLIVNVGFRINELIMVVFTTLFSLGISQILACLTILFGQKGRILFVIVCASIGGIAGFTYSMAQNEDIFVFLAKYNIPIYVCIGAIILYLIGTVFNYKIIQKYEVRV